MTNIFVLWIISKVAKNISAGIEINRILGIILKNCMKSYRRKNGKRKKKYYRETLNFHNDEKTQKFAIVWSVYLICLVEEMHASFAYHRLLISVWKWSVIPKCWHSWIILISNFKVIKFFYSYFNVVVMVTNNIIRSLFCLRIHCLVNNRLNFQSK